MKQLIIMRGLPGSGKTTYLNTLEVEDGKYVICSADHFFLVTGEYHFDPRLLGKAHEACKTDAEIAMQAGIELVIIDNTNTQKWEYEDYLKMATKYNYNVTIQVIGNTTDLELYATRNTHGVPLAGLQRMAARWEP